MKNVQAYDKAMLINLSECGALILTPRVLNLRDFIHVKLLGVTADAIQCKARVVHLAGDKVHPVHFYAGLRFQDLIEQHKLDLRHFIQRRAEEAPLQVG